MNHLMNTSTEWQTHPAAKVGPLRAGDAMLFTERLTHGTLPWLANHKVGGGRSAGPSWHVAQL